MTLSKVELLALLKARFQTNMQRHPDIIWDQVQARLEESESKIVSLLEMERTGGEPDVVGQDSNTGEFIFCDCVKESPEGRRNCCYDGKSQEQRMKKGVYPNGNVMDMVSSMGAELLNEEQYRNLQRIGEFDLKTSSWILTPPNIRSLGGALFADRRYGQVFVYHNSAPSFYSSRGFRSMLRV